LWLRSVNYLIKTIIIIIIITFNLNIADRRHVITSLMNSRERTLAIANK